MRRLYRRYLPSYMKREKYTRAHMRDTTAYHVKASGQSHRCWKATSVQTVVEILR